MKENVSLNGYFSLFSVSLHRYLSSEATVKILQAGEYPVEREKDYIRSGTSMPKSDIPFLIVDATFFESTRRKSRRELFSSFRMG
ncbi:MAG: hypothetical protein XE13_0074 [Proteiniphilum sp. 51_7]|nr:MAG: hypothetical protein XE13_0074 [Proteiniphilum sp. 51_7]